MDGWMDGCRQWKLITQSNPGLSLNFNCYVEVAAVRWNLASHRLSGVMPESVSTPTRHVCPFRFTVTTSAPMRVSQAARLHLRQQNRFADFGGVGGWWFAWLHPLTRSLLRSMLRHSEMRSLTHVLLHHRCFTYWKGTVRKIVETITFLVSGSKK